MAGFSFAQVLDALGVRRTRADQWIARGHFKVSETTASTREWSFGDAMRLAVFARLQKDVSADHAGRLTERNFHGFRDDKALFVVWSGWTETAIQQHGRRVKIRTPEAWSSKIIPSRELGDFINSDLVETAIIIKLDTLKDELEAILPRAEKWHR